MSRSLLFVLLTAGVLALTLAGCVPGATPEAAVSAAAATAAPAATAISAPTAEPSRAALLAPTAEPAPTAGAYPLTLKDELGREVKLAARPSRIVSLAPSITEVLFAVGAGSQVVGVTEYCNYPPEAKQGRELVGGYTSDTMSIEKIVSLKPDLVLAGGAEHKTVIEALEQAGVLVFSMDPKDFPGIYADIQAAGALTGNAAQAEQVVSEMKARVAKVVSIAEKIPQNHRVKVFYEVWDEPLMTAGSSTFIGQAIEMAGAINIFASLQEQYPTVSSEAVIAASPQVIIGPSSHGEALTVERITGRPGWANLDAVKSGHIVIVDGDMISRFGPRLADALEALAAGIYPGKFE